MLQRILDHFSGYKKYPFLLCVILFGAPTSLLIQSQLSCPASPSLLEAFPHFLHALLSSSLQVVSELVYSLASSNYKRHCGTPLVVNNYAAWIVYLSVYITLFPCSATHWLLKVLVECVKSCVLLQLLIVMYEGSKDSCCSRQLVMMKFGS